ncbi:MAG: trypsin-like peptidase domain-containing protein [Propionicimonas sp.]
MGRPGAAVAAIAGALILVGCVSLPPLVPVRAVDSAPFAPLLELASPSVGKVSGSACSGGTLVGSAFVVGNHLVMTAAHVAAGARSIELSFPGLPRVSARLVALIADDDTALLRVSGQLPPPLRLATTPVAAGDPVAVLGFPIPDPVVHTGVARISAVDERALLEGHLVLSLLVLDAEVPVGSSGGPVVDATGAVQGMVSAQLSGRGGRDSSRLVTLAIPSARLASRLTSWADLPTPTPCT